ncbi:MAG TPA: UdgX family uracil-DNA binding protein [Actinomycetota bacterium]
MATRKSDVPTAEPFLPERRTLGALREAAATCEGCDLYRNATQTVFGEGRLKARVMFVGEQPGDSEDRQGRPFVGPAGRLLDRALDEAGIDRSLVYVTNAVKHFKWEPRGKRRIHKNPAAEEIRACRPWLDAEIDAVKPEVVVALGATAAKAVIGPKFRVTEQRGEFVDTPLAAMVTATVHPSSILRAPDDTAREQAYAAFVRDLLVVAGAMRSAKRAG